MSMRYRSKITVVVLVLYTIVLLAVFKLPIQISRQDKEDTVVLHQHYGHGSLVLPEAGYINVVEEHHEVLMYWYSAAETGALKRQGNTLLHIDGHSDADDPHRWRHMPLFRMPRNQEDVKLMMEGNDDFIHAAAATGLINRYIWIWPPYDSEGYGHHNGESYLLLNLDLGTAFIKGDDDGDGEYTLYRCFCVVINKDHNNKYCAYTDDDDDYINIQEDECLDKILTGIVEFVSVEKAMELATTGTWIKESDSVILDIDEDFYACESASTPLYNAGMEKAAVEDISFRIGKLFCVDNAKDESAVDQYFYKLVQTVLEVNRNCGQLSVAHCSDLARRKRVLDKTANLTPTVRGLMCLPHESSSYIMSGLLTRLLTCQDDQLFELARVGVCMNESPRTTTYNKNDGMVLCKGYLGPNTTQIPYHSAEEKELIQTTQHLDAILSQPFIPGVITLVRSVRDGYTPRHNFDSIEPKVMNILKSKYHHRTNNNTIHYDSELLGGKNGWYLRHSKKKNNT